jgi:hypothetical protein
MSALGQKQTWRSEITMSALPPKADIPQRRLDVRFVPKVDIAVYRQNLPESVPEKRRSVLSAISVSLKNPPAHEPQFDDRQRICRVTV